MSILKRFVFVSAAASALLFGRQPQAMPQSPADSLTRTEASHFAQLALKCIQREYPNKLDHVMNDASEVQSPKALHPAFYGCYDWHSSVHGHWMLVHLLRRFPDIPEAGEIRTKLTENLSAENLRRETAYLGQKSRESFERTYGWAWILKLAEELRGWEDADGGRWSRNVQGLAAAVVQRYVSFLPKQTYPIRTGVHPNTAFGLTLAWDYARVCGDQKLQGVIAERSRAYYAADKDYPAAWEPGGEDFLSPCLEEADLMRRVLQPEEFTRWFHGFLPRIEQGEPRALLHPAVVTDRTDPKLVHLDGLNLSRAWCMRSIASALTGSDAARAVLAKAAKEHAEAALGHVSGGDYVGEHWLATFAVYLLSTPIP
jgi:hypothetical protein